MFFQPKFYRGKAVPPQIYTSGQMPVNAVAPPPPSRARIGSVPMLSTETFDDGGVKPGREGDMRRPSLPEYKCNIGSRSGIDHFDSLYTLDHSQPISPLFGPIDFSSPRASPLPLPPTPTFDASSPPLPLPQYPRTPSQNHSASPSLGSLSSTSTASYASESLLTPIRSYLHPVAPLSPSIKAPSRPLPPPPAITADSPRSSRPNSPCPSSRKAQTKPHSFPTPSSSSRRSLRTPPPPPGSASMYASMPLPPIPTLPPMFSRSGSAETTQKRNKRDSQAMVRPGDIRRQREAREIRDTMRPLPPLPRIVVEDPVFLYDGRRGSGLSIQGESDLDMTDIRSALDAFPVPPSHRPSSPPSQSSSRPTTASGQHEALNAPPTNKKDHRQSSRSTIRPNNARKVPPPPLPAFQFDLFSISDEVPVTRTGERGASEKDMRVALSEAEEIRLRYLTGLSIFLSRGTKR